MAEKWCQEHRFGQVRCGRPATVHAMGFAAQDVDLCDFHADVLRKFEGWKFKPIDAARGKL